MANVTQYSIKLSIAFAIMLMVSCGEKGALKEETLYFDDLNRDWIIDSEPGDNFLMTDNNGIAQSFMMNQNTSYFNKSWGGVLMITTHMTHTEYHYQYFASNYGTTFSLSLTAGNDPFGDEIYITLDGIEFAWDIKLEVVSRIYTPFGYKSKTMTNKGYEENEPIGSVVEMIDSIEINGTVYSDVLHFTLNDFQESWTDFTMSEIFVAKRFGLIKYRYNNGVESLRNTQSLKSPG